MAKKVKRPLDTGFKVVLGLLALVVVILIIWGGVAIVNNLPGSVRNVGAAATTTAVDVPPAIETVTTVLLGKEAMFSWEALVLYLAIFVILLFTFSDLISLFGIFNNVTSWVVGFGLALIAGVTNVVKFIAGVFAITAGIGAIGISILVLTAIFAGVVLNLGIRGPLKRWQNARQKEIEKFKADKGFGKMAGFITGAKEGAEAAAEGEKTK